MPMQRSKLVMLMMAAAIVLFTAGCSKLRSRDEMNKGVQAYKNAHYQDAINHFKAAVQLDPTNQNAQLYLATSYMTQWVPGVDSPDNKKNYNMAQQEFQNILKKEPSNSLALASLASMAYNSAAAGSPEQKTAALEEAKKWNQRRIEANPKESEAYYYLGVIDWAQAFPALQTVRVEQKMSPNDPGPIKNPKIRQELQAKYSTMINEGIENLKK